MSRFHSKFHGKNHHSEPTSGYPDSALDPIASEAAPFQGDFWVDGGLHATGSSNIDQLISSNIITSSLSASNLNADNLEVDNIEIVNLGVNEVNAVNVNSESGDIDDLNATILTVDSLSADNGVFGTISIQEITNELAQLTVSSGIFTNIQANSITTSSLIGDNIGITGILTTEGVNASTINSNIVDTFVLSADESYINNSNVSVAIIEELYSLSSHPDNIYFPDRIVELSSFETISYYHPDVADIPELQFEDLSPWLIMDDQLSSFGLTSYYTDGIYELQAVEDASSVVETYHVISDQILLSSYEEEREVGVIYNAHSIETESLYVTNIYDENENQILTQRQVDPSYSTLPNYEEIDNLLSSISTVEDLVQTLNDDVITKINSELEGLTDKLNSIISALNNHGLIKPS